jgi:flagellar motor switch protein FliG
MKADDRPLDGAEKTALLLLLLEEPEAAALLARLDPREVEAVGRAMISVSEASPATIDSVLGEVLAIARETVAVGEGAPTMRHMLGAALGPDRAIGLIERIGTVARPPLFERLAWLEPPAIASLLDGEHPQAQALLLANLPVDVAARVLAALPAEYQPDLVRRVAILGPVAPQALEALDTAVSARVATTPPRQPVTGLGGTRRAADLVNRANLDEERALAALKEADAEAADALAEQLFTFADLVQLDDRALQTLMRSLDAALLVPALRGASQAVRDRLLGAMPQRAAQALEGEMEDRGRVRRDEADAAQKEIAAAARRLAADGTIGLPGKGPAYV